MGEMTNVENGGPSPEHIPSHLVEDVVLQVWLLGENEFLDGMAGGTVAFREGDNGFLDGVESRRHFGCQTSNRKVLQRWKRRLGLHPPDRFPFE
jgi:hypothetical protein